MNIREGVFDDPQVIALVQVHLRIAASESPPESFHALDVSSLQVPAIRFWTVWEEGLKQRTLNSPQVDGRRGANSKSKVALEIIESKASLDLNCDAEPDPTNESHLRSGALLLGCGALKTLSAAHGEVKSMHTAEAARGRGVGTAMLNHVIAEARAMGMTRLSLETGTTPYFLPAHRLYERHGFIDCGPFADYVPDPNSRFMTRELGVGSRE